MTYLKIIAGFYIGMYVVFIVVATLSDVMSLLIGVLR
jgi:hypothetical protein